jgi:hypothetical protein
MNERGSVFLIIVLVVVGVVAVGSGTLYYFHSKDLMQTNRKMLGLHLIM